MLTNRETSQLQSAEDLRLLTALLDKLKASQQTHHISNNVIAELQQLVDRLEATPEFQIPDDINFHELWNKFLPKRDNQSRRENILNLLTHANKIVAVGLLSAIIYQVSTKPEGEELLRQLKILLALANGAELFNLILAIVKVFTAEFHNERYLNVISVFGSMFSTGFLALGTADFYTQTEPSKRPAFLIVSGMLVGLACAAIKLIAACLRLHTLNKRIQEGRIPPDQLQHQIAERNFLKDKYFDRTRSYLRNLAGEMLVIAAAALVLIGGFQNIGLIGFALTVAIAFSFITKTLADIGHGISNNMPVRPTLRAPRENGMFPPATTIEVNNDAPLQETPNVEPTAANVLDDEEMVTNRMPTN